MEPFGVGYRLRILRIRCATLRDPDLDTTAIYGNIQVSSSRCVVDGVE
jgi:hypothetical protein